MSSTHPTGSPKQGGGAYSTAKLAEHPEALEALRDGRSKLTTVHLMPQNVCNQSCEFCSYRLEDNKNSEAFDESSHIPKEMCDNLLDDFAELGVKGVELTGGGEPLAYPHIRHLLKRLRRHGFSVGIVTNGTLLERCASDLLALGDHLRWVRVSIDAGCRETYRQMRGAHPGQWDKAWAAVSWLSDNSKSFHPEFEVGVGFVQSNSNLGEAEAFVEKARQAGAHNVRLSLTFSDKQREYFTDPVAVALAVQQSEGFADRFNTDRFTVYNMMPRRWNETAHPQQDYEKCYTKDLLCVVEGSCKVYTCCTFTGSLRGLYGTFSEHPEGFRGLWESKEIMRQTWDSRISCPVSCLYRERNLAMIEMLKEPKHKDFI